MNFIKTKALVLKLGCPGNLPGPNQNDRDWICLRRSLGPGTFPSSLGGYLMGNEALGTTVQGRLCRGQPGPWLMAHSSLAAGLGVHKYRQGCWVMVTPSSHPHCPLESPGELKKEGTGVPSDLLNRNLGGSPCDSNGQPELKPSSLRSPSVVWACASTPCQSGQNQTIGVWQRAPEAAAEQFPVPNMPETRPLMAIPKASNSLSPAAHSSWTWQVPNSEPG